MSWYTSSEIKDRTDVMSFQTKLGQNEAVLGRFRKLFKLQIMWCKLTETTAYVFQTISTFKKMNFCDYIGKSSTKWLEKSSIWLQKEVLTIKCCHFDQNDKVRIFTVV